MVSVTRLCIHLFVDYYCYSLCAEDLSFLYEKNENKSERYQNYETSAVPADDAPTPMSTIPLNESGDMYQALPQDPSVNCFVYRKFEFFNFLKFFFKKRRKMQLHQLKILLPVNIKCLMSKL